ncbi:hypothetical protein KHQ81_12835 [Mycoplasmatota bacterium]|nr:hypothetical protein KHQ81_12835 [Mycoplasmatota bacterium]
MLRIEISQGQWVESPNLLPYPNHLKLDESFDNAVVQRIVNSKESLPVLTKVQLIDGNKVFDYLVNNSPTERIGYNAYIQTLELIEPTEIAKGIQLDNITITQPLNPDIHHPKKMLDEEIDRILEITPVVKLDNIDKTILYKFEIDPQIRTFFHTIDSPDFSFSEYTLFDFLVDIGMYLDMFPRIKFGNYETNGKLMISFDELDVKNKNNYIVENNNRVETQQPLENYANTVISNVSNLSVDDIIVHPAEGLGVYVNAPEGKSEITDDNAIITLPNRINKIIKIEGYYIGPSSTTKAWYDVTKYIYEFKEWETLKPAALVSADPWNTKDYTLYYKYNDKHIMNIKGFCHGGDGPLSNEVRTTMYRITYIPYIDTKTSQSNQAKTEYAVIYNQNNNIIENSVYSKHLKNYIKRMENGDEILSKIYNSLDDLPQLGHYVNDDYILTNLSYTKYYNYYDVTKQLSKGYTRRAEFIRAKNEIRTWEIPATGRIENRNILIGEKLYIGVLKSDLSNYEKENSVSINPSRFDLILENEFNFLVNKPQENRSIFAGLRFHLKNDTIIPAKVVVSRAIYGNKIIYEIKTLNNTLLGYSKSLNWVSKVNNQLGVTYTDEYGNFETVDIGFSHSFDFLTKEDFARDYPLSNETEVNGFFHNAEITLNQLNVKKDAREIINLTYNLEYKTIGSLFFHDKNIKKYRNSINSYSLKLYFFTSCLSLDTSISDDFILQLTFNSRTPEISYESDDIDKFNINYSFSSLETTIVDNLQTIVLLVEETKDIIMLINDDNSIEQLKTSLRSGEFNVYFK